MRYKKEYKKSIQRKLTTRKRWKNNLTLLRRTQYKMNKSYKKMKGGLVYTTKVQEMLNRTNNDPSIFIDDKSNPKLIGALIIQGYNAIQTQFKSARLPDIPDKPTPLNETQTKSISILINYYKSVINDINDAQVFSEYSQFLGLKHLIPEEFRRWLTYILEGKSYQKKITVYTDGEFHNFKLLALSLHKLWKVHSSKHKPEYSDGQNTRLFSYGFSDRW